MPKFLKNLNNSNYFAVILRRISWLLFILGSVYFISAYWILYGISTEAIPRDLVTHFLGAGVGFVIAILISKYMGFFDFIKRHHLLGLLGALALFLLLLTPLGYEVNNAVRWIDLGFISFQPSEIFKLVFIIFLAAFLSKGNQKLTEGTKNIWVGVLALTLLPFAAFQTDYDLLIILFFVLVGMYLASSVSLGKYRKSIIIFISTLVIGGAVYAFQKISHIHDRLVIAGKYLFNKEITTEELSSIAYQTNQNRKIVEEAGWTGHIGENILNTFDNVAELLTDSIFIQIIGEGGLIMTTIIFISFLVFVFIIAQIARYAKDEYSFLLAFGILILFVIQLCLNLFSVNVSILSGVPLIFFSKGGTSIGMTIIAIGLLHYIAKYKLRAKI